MFTENLLVLPIEQALDSIRLSRAECEEDTDEDMENNFSNGPNGSSLILFDSAAANHYNNRTFKGLNEFGENDDNNIHMGNIGIATSYSRLS